MKKLQKLLTILFILTILLFIFSFKYDTYAAENVYNKSTTAKKGDIVYFQKPENWGSSIPYLYAWDNYNNPQNKLGGDFPGVAMTLISDNLYKYEFDTDIAYVKLIFSDGTSNNQTKDLDYICNGYIYKFDDTAALGFSIISLQLGDTVYFEKPESWEDDIYIYLWNNSTNNNNANWDNKPAMTKVSGNTYSYTLSNSDNHVSDGFDKVIFATNNGKQTIDLSTIGNNLTFKTKQNAETTGDNYGKWDGRWMYQFNKSSLSNLVRNTTVPVENKNYYTENSWKIYEEQFNLAKLLLNTRYIAASFADLTSQYDKSLLALKFAYDQLELNTTILSDKIDEMKDVDTSKYEEGLVEDFNNTIKNAEQALSDPDSLTVEEMKDLIKDMEEAKDKLTVDKSELESLIEKTKEIDESLYTDESTKTLEEALKKATEVFENPDASYFDVQDQIKNLNDAISSLVLKKDENIDQPENSDNTVTDNDNNDNNPFTGDIVYIIFGILILAITLYIITTLYLKKQKNK